MDDAGLEKALLLAVSQGDVQSDAFAAQCGVDHKKVIGLMKSLEASELITRLLVVEPSERLGAKGVHEIKSSAFFNGIDWAVPLWQLPSICMPTLRDPLDTSNFNMNAQARFYDARTHAEFERGGGGGGADDGGAAAAVVIDCGGARVAPGFIDLQINGAFGVDFSSAACGPDDVRRVARRLVAHGVTAFAPTLVSLAPAQYRERLPRLRAARGATPPATAPPATPPRPGAEVLGLHLEGPFFAVAKRGAHDAALLRAPSDGARSLDATYGADNLDGVAVVTLAPELPGALDAVREGIVGEGFANRCVRERDAP